MFCVFESVNMSKFRLGVKCSITAPEYKRKTGKSDCFFGDGIQKKRTRKKCCRSVAIFSVPDEGGYTGFTTFRPEEMRRSFTLSIKAFM